MSVRIIAGLLFLPLAAFGRVPVPAAVGPLTGDKLPPGSYTGKLFSLPTADGSFTVEITTQVPEEKPNSVSLLASNLQFQKDFQSGLNSIKTDIGNSKDQQTLFYHQKRLTDHLAWYQRHLPAYQPGGSHYPIQFKNVTQSVDFQADAKMLVRVLEPPMQYNDKGLPKKYTSKELNKLKGKDKNAPGFEAQKDDLATGAMVRVTLVRHRQPRIRGERSAVDVLKGPKNVVTTIVIVSKDGNTTSPNTKK